MMLHAFGRKIFSVTYIEDSIIRTEANSEKSLKRRLRSVVVDPFVTASLKPIERMQFGSLLRNFGTSFRF